MNGLNGMMADQKEMTHDSPEEGSEDKVNLSEEKDECTKETNTALKNHENIAGDSVEIESTLDENINSINNEDHELNDNNETHNSDSNETSLEHSQSTPNCKINENNTNSCAKIESTEPCEKTISNQSNLKVNLGQNNELSIEETCKKDLLLQNGNTIIPFKNGVSLFFFISFKKKIIICHIFF